MLLKGLGSMSEGGSDMEFMELCYGRAEEFMKGAYGSKKLALNTSVIPYWIGSSDQFWYGKETLEGNCYILVNANSGTQRPAFDHKGRH